MARGRASTRADRFAARFPYGLSLRHSECARGRRSLERRLSRSHLGNQTPSPIPTGAGRPPLPDNGLSCDRDRPVRIRLEAR